MKFINKIRCLLYGHNPAYFKAPIGRMITYSNPPQPLMRFTGENGLHIDINVCTRCEKLWAKVSRE